MFNWASKEEEAFHVVKDTLGGPLPLAHYDPRQKLIVAANACQFEIGGALLQRYADGTEKYVFHMSKAISSSQRNYISQIEKEFFFHSCYSCGKILQVYLGTTFYFTHRQITLLFSACIGLPKQKYLAKELQLVIGDRSSASLATILI